MDYSNQIRFLKLKTKTIYRCLINNVEEIQVLTDPRESSAKHDLNEKYLLNLNINIFYIVRRVKRNIFKFSMNK